MAVLDIKRAGNPVLKKVSEPVKRIDKKVKRILKDMTDTLYKSGNGIGLAAPQVGILQRIVVIDLQDGKGLLELINPVITKKEGSRIACEGCLSVPNFEGEVERAEYVECEYTDPHGKKQDEHDGSDGNADVFQMLLFHGHTLSFSAPPERSGFLYLENSRILSS